MSRRIALACVAVGLALVGGVLLVIGGIARAADPPPTLNLREPLPSTPVYSIDVTEGLTLTLPVSNPLTSPAQVTVTAELEKIVEVTTGDSAAGMFSSLSPVSQTVGASEVLTFTLSLEEQPPVTELYTGTLRLSTTGPDLSPPITTTQPFTLNVLVSAPERGAITPTLSLRLVGSDGELLSSPPVYRVLVSDEEGWQSAELGVHNVGSEELAIAAGPLTVTLDNEFVPATLGLLPVSQTVAVNEVVTFTLSLTEGWLPTGKYSASLEFSAEGVGSKTEPFVLLVSPWEAELEWAQEKFVYKADEAHTEATIQFIARHADAKDIRAQLPTVAPKDTLTVTFSTMDFLRIEPPLLPTLTQDKVTTLTLNFITSTLPTPGTYNGELQLSASNAAPITKTLTLVVPDCAPISPWESKLDWAQKEFIYEVDSKHTEATIWVVAHRADATNVQAELTTLEAGSGISETFSTADFLVIPPSGTLKQDEVVSVTLTFTTTQLPEPGTYTGPLRLSASNAAPITKTLTLVVPEERALGSYKIAYAELGRTPVVSPTLPVTKTEALQFTGARWLPASTSVGQWGPKLAGALLLGIALAALVEYAGWAHFWHRVRQRHVFAVGVGVVAFLLVWCLSDSPDYLRRLGLAAPDPTQAHVGPRTLLIWETEGRGPVRDITVQGKEVASEIGYTGQISVGVHAGRIEAGGVLTVPIDIEDLSRPSAYVGHILIQSPDIKEGVKKVPVQVTVHDSLLWPALVIMLGVILGGYVKYQQGIASKRLEKRRDIEQEWQKWDDYMSSDDYLYPVPKDGVGRINPLYEKVWHRLNRVVKLLEVNPEWAMDDADSTVSVVKEQLDTYQRLSEAVTSWSEDLAPETGKSRSESDIGKARDWIKEAKRALRRGDLPDATIFVGKLIRDALPGGIKGLRELVEEKLKDEKDEKKKKALQDIKALLDQADALCKQGIHGGAWLKFKEAEHQLRQLGVVIPLFVSLWKPPKEPPKEEYKMKAEEPGYRIRLLRDVDRYPGDIVEIEVVRISSDGEVESPLPGVTCEWAVISDDPKAAEWDEETKTKPRTKVRFYQEGPWKVKATVTEGNTKYYPDLELQVKPCTYKIREFVPEARHYVENTIPLEVVRLGEDDESVGLPDDAICRWKMDQEESVEFDKEGRRTEVTFYKIRRWTVTVTVKVPKEDKLEVVGTAELPLDIKESRMVMIYKDKRRQSFNRRLAALLLALVGGIAAKRVFGLTFGSFEEYLEAFGWGVGASLGIDPVAGTVTAIQLKLGELLSLKRDQG